MEPLTMICEIVFEESTALESSWVIIFDNVYSLRYS